MTEAGWTAGKDVKEIGWYWWRLHPHRMKVVEVVQDYEGGPLRSYVNGMWIYLEQSGAEWLGPLSPDDKAQGRVEGLREAANYYKQPSKNGGVYSVSGGHIGNLMDWCKDNLKHCKFSGPDEDNLDLDLVQTAQQIPQLKTELSQLQALVRAAASAPGKDWLEWQLKLGEALDGIGPKDRALANDANREMGLPDDEDWGDK